MSDEVDPTRRASNADPDGPDEEAGEQSYRLRTALIDGVSFTSKPVVYTDVKGWAIFEGDIRLGRIDELEASTDLRRAVGRAGSGRADVAADVSLRWPGGVIPYEIDPALPSQNRVHDAIAHWQSRTPIQFVLHSGEADFIRFVPGDGCRSFVGRQGGRQDIDLSERCTTGAAIHEIFHAVGAWHEQSREDRDSFVRIVWENVTAGEEHNFTQHVTDSDDIGPYDYDSIMHYPRGAFSRNGQDTIVPLEDGAQIGQRDHLSVWDVEAVRAMYPHLSWPKQNKEYVKAENPKDQPKDSPKDLGKDGLKDDPKDGVKDGVKDQWGKGEEPYWKESPKSDWGWKEEPKEQFREGMKIIKDPDILTRGQASDPGPRTRTGGPGAQPFVIAGGTGSRGGGRPPTAPANTGLLPQLQELLASFAALNYAGTIDRRTIAAWRLTTRAYLKLLGRSDEG